MRLATAALLLTVPALAQSPTHKASPSPESKTGLPVTHVSLYKNGVGFFELTGQVSGNAAVTIDFTSAQLNDVLQSLTAIDMNGGRISGAGYNSTTPLDQQLRNLPLALNDNPTVQSFYASLRGARIEVRSGAIIFAGRLLSVESGGAAGNPSSAPGGSSDSNEHMLLTVVADSGDVRTIVVTANTTVRLVEPALHVDVSHYLELLDSTRSQGLRHLTIDDHGTGTRELRVSYISEVPVWKSTYRILLTTPKSSSASPTATVQGWSVVDNTTGTDWNNVQLSLIAGAPQSFIQPLSQPIYSRRPEIAVAQEAQLSPQTFASAFSGGQSGSGLAGVVRDPSGAIIPNASITATNQNNGHRESATSDSQGRFSMPLGAGSYRVSISSPGFQTVVQSNVAVDGEQYASLSVPLPIGSASETVTVNAESAMLNTNSSSFASVSKSVRNRYVSPSPRGLPAPPPPPPRAMSYEDAVSGSFAASTENANFDDFFAYNISEPITIHKNESALVPILQAKVAAEAVTLVHAGNGSISNPLRALWLTNDTGTTFDRGSFSVIEDGKFGGEGLLDPVHVNEKRLLTYAADQAIRVSTENGSGTNRIVRISASRGILTVQRGQHEAITYLVHNAAAESRTVVLEHPVRNGYLLDSSIKPDESTPELYRFRIAVPSGETVRFPVAANHIDYTTYQLTDFNENELTVLLQQAGNDQKLATALAPVLEARRKSAETDEAVDQTNTKLENLHADEDRQRANITALANADKSSRDRFVHDLNVTEDAIKATQHELDVRTAAHDAAEADLSAKIEAFTYDESL